jgi:hypothetical protein
MGPRIAPLPSLQYTTRSNPRIAEPTPPAHPETLSRTTLGGLSLHSQQPTPPSPHYSPPAPQCTCVPQASKSGATCRSSPVSAGVYCLAQMILPGTYGFCEDLAPDMHAGIKCSIFMLAIFYHSAGTVSCVLPSPFPLPVCFCSASTCCPARLLLCVLPSPSPFPNHPVCSTSPYCSDSSASLYSAHLLLSCILQTPEVAVQGCPCTRGLTPQSICFFRALHQK